MPTPDLPAGLDAALDDCWRRLAAAVDDRRCGFRLPVVATGGAAGPDARVMVLRAVDRAAHRVAFHTDRRAAKVAAIAAVPRVAITAWDAPLQLRLYGAATIVTAGAARDAAWAAVGAGSRDYASTAPPGTAVADPAADAGDGDGRANFAVLDVVVDRLEWLELARGGHRRAAYVRDGAAWRGTWLVP